MASVSVLRKDYPKTIIKLSRKDYPKTKINEVLPFRIRFKSIGLVGESVNTPPIGIAVIGVNFYIL